MSTAAAAMVAARSPPGGYLTQFGDFFLGHTGQDCASVCFSAGRSCSSDLSRVGADVFSALGLTCKALPQQLSGATTTRYRFPGWVSAGENAYFGSCFNVNGAVGGDVSCTELWDSGSRVCHCPDEGKSAAAGWLRVSGMVEAVVAAVLLLYLAYIFFKRCRRRCCPPHATRFASIKDSFNDFEADEEHGLGGYNDDDDNDDDDDDDDDGVDSESSGY